MATLPAHLETYRPILHSLSGLLRASEASSLVKSASKGLVRCLFKLTENIAVTGYLRPTLTIWSRLRQKRHKTSIRKILTETKWTAVRHLFAANLQLVRLVAEAAVDTSTGQRVRHSATLRQRAIDASANDDDQEAVESSEPDDADDFDEDGDNSDAGDEQFDVDYQRPSTSTRY